MKKVGIVCIGHGCATAMETAIAALTAKHPDIIVVDINQIKDAPKFTPEPFRQEETLVPELKEYNYFEEKRDNRPFYHNIPKKRRRKK